LHTGPDWATVPLFYSTVGRGARAKGYSSRYVKKKRKNIKNNLIMLTALLLFKLGIGRTSGVGVDMI